MIWSNFLYNWNISKAWKSVAALSIASGEPLEMFRGKTFLL